MIIYMVYCFMLNTKPSPPAQEKGEKRKNGGEGTPTNELLQLSSRRWFVEGDSEPGQTSAASALVDWSEWPVPRYPC